MEEEAMESLAESAVAKLRAERDETLRRLLPLAESDCRYPAQWAGTDRSVNFLLRAFTSHQLDHLQHAQKLLRNRAWSATEPQMLLMKAHALQGELEALFLSLSDEDFTRAGPDDGDWSAQQIVEHLAEIERHYREEILRAVERGRAQTPAAP
jgi:hypothetical protein